MERIAIAGLSLHQTDVEGLEQAKQALARLEAPGTKALADGLGASEAVLLSTCNRIEFVFAREAGHAPDQRDGEALAAILGLDPACELAQRFFLHTGRAAARHLLRVSASLDSLVLGEDQILAQLREAYTQAQDLGMTGHLLGALFDHAITFGKRVRTTTDLSRHPVSVVSLGVAFLTERLEGVTAPRVAVIGAGATGAHAARALTAAGIRPAWIVNRSEARARTLAEEVGSHVLTLESLRGGREPVDAVVSATSAPDVVLDEGALRDLAARTPAGRRLVAVDLAVPRDLAPCEGAPIDRIDLETLGARAAANRAKRAAAAARAELLVEEKLSQLFHEREAEALTGPYAAINARAREAFELELARLSEGRLAHLDARDRTAVERWARLTFGRIAHVPFQALKRLAREDLLPHAEWEGLE